MLQRLVSPSRHNAKVEASIAAEDVNSKQQQVARAASRMQHLLVEVRRAGCPSSV